MDIWTEPATQRFLELTGDHNLYYKQIAETLTAEFNIHFTKNACIGKAKRMGLPERDTAVPGRPKKKRVYPPKKSAPLPMYSRAQRIKALHDGVRPRRRSYPQRKPVGGVMLIDLKHHHCRYVIGEIIDKGRTRFCGEQKLDDSPYCQTHHNITHTGRHR